MTSELNYGGLDAGFTELEKAKIVVLPVPYDETSTWGKGADLGPDAILEASANMELYDIETDSEVYKQGIYTADPIIEKSSPEAMVDAVHRKCLEYLKMKKFVVGIGGEHSVTPGFVRAYHELFPDMCVLQLDAHTDLRPEYNGTPYSHACAMSRVRELCPVIQVGIRSMDSIEKPYLVKENLFLAEDIHYHDAWMDKAISRLGKNVFITIDLDVFDPSIMPSTGTPEPGGLLWYQVITFLRKVNENRNIIGFDVVELAPNQIERSSDFLASKLIYKILSYRFQKSEN